MLKRYSVKVADIIQCFLPRGTSLSRASTWQNSRICPPYRILFRRMCKDLISIIFYPQLLPKSSSHERLCCENEHKSKSLPLNRCRKRLSHESPNIVLYHDQNTIYHIKATILNQEQYQRICVISLNPDNEPSPQTLQDSSSSEILSTLSYSINKKSLSE